MKIAVVTSYRYPDYIRAIVLRDSLALIPGVEVIVVKNTSKGIARYPQSLWRLLKTRLTKHPDVYLLTFRGYEALPFVRLISIGKPLIFDELINGVELYVHEHKNISGIPAKILAAGYRFWLNLCRIILADTPSHADASSSISRIDRGKYVVIPVGTDEKSFTYNPRVLAHEPREFSADPISLTAAERKPFLVFFYGFMRPLHGPQYVVQAAEMMKDNPDIQFLIGGRIEEYEELIKEAQSKGANLEYRQWIPYEELPELLDKADVSIAGPFGTTFQAQHVINGKVYQFLASGRVALIGENSNTGRFINHENSLVVPRGDAAAIVHEVQWAYDNQDQLPRIATNGRALYDELYSNKVIAGQLEAMLKTLEK